ncbi:MAG: prephenate dehydrogenase [Oscillospiraceae bacterium]|nr:prephenate dehydrogenase [Oscillospiraceae bacterium]
MTVGVVGLGLIGGSIAKAYSAAGHTVLAYDTDSSILSFAIMSGGAAGELNETNLKDCDLVLIAIFPKDAAEYIRNNGPHFSKTGLVIDCCGTKEEVCKAGFEAAAEHGFLYVGGHPMAGTHHSGYRASNPDLFRGAPMVIVPPVYDDITLFDRVKTILEPLGFGSISVTTAKEHDTVIAFTSQLAHVVSNAYIKSPTAKVHKGFSAGSYRDLTRVAWLNPIMWAELFLNNRDNMIFEIDTIVNELVKYKDALERSDRATLEQLLADGANLKKEIDG